MEENVATSSESPHTASTDTTIGGILPPNPPSPVWTTVVSTSSILGSGPIPSSVETTALFTQSVAGPPFSYVMLSFDMNSVLSYSTLQTMGLGVGISNSLMQGSTGGTFVSFNDIPYGGGHIPPLSPSLDNDFQQHNRSSVNYSLFGESGLGTSSHTTTVGSMSFSLFNAFGNNSFSLASISTGGNHGFGQHNPVQGTIPTQGEST
jgi:hypothetical protein